jgi:hypothetical protein
MRLITRLASGKSLWMSASLGSSIAIASHKFRKLTLPRDAVPAIELQINERYKGYE